MLIVHATTPDGTFHELQLSLRACARDIAAALPAAAHGKALSVMAHLDEALTGGAAEAHLCDGQPLQELLPVDARGQPRTDAPLVVTLLDDGSGAN